MQREKVQKGVGKMKNGHCHNVKDPKETVPKVLGILRDRGGEGRKRRREEEREEEGEGEGE